MSRNLHLKHFIRLAFFQVAKIKQEFEYALKDTMA